LRRGRKRRGRAWRGMGGGRRCTRGLSRGGRGRGGAISRLYLGCILATSRAQSRRRATLAHRSCGRLEVRGSARGRREGGARSSVDVGLALPGGPGLGHLSATSRRPLGDISATSRPPLDDISTTSRPRIGGISAAYRQCAHPPRRRTWSGRTRAGRASAPRAARLRTRRLGRVVDVAWAGHELSARWPPTRSGRCISAICSSELSVLPMPPCTHRMQPLTVAAIGSHSKSRLRRRQTATPGFLPPSRRAHSCRKPSRAFTWPRGEGRADEGRGAGGACVYGLLCRCPIHL